MGLEPLDLTRFLRCLGGVRPGPAGELGEGGHDLVGGVVEVCVAIGAAGQVRQCQLRSEGDGDVATLDAVVPSGPGVIAACDAAWDDGDAAGEGEAKCAAAGSLEAAVPA